MLESVKRLKSSLHPLAQCIDQYDGNYDTFRRQFASYSGEYVAQKESSNGEDQELSPELIIIPFCESDIQRCVAFAGQNDYKVVARSGGHQYSGLSSLSGNRTMQIDMRNFVELKIEEAAKFNMPNGSSNQLRHQETFKVVVGAGIRLRELYAALDKYNLLIPAGICMNVCAGGHFQSGASGIFSKSFGLGIEHVTHVRLVLASGEIVTVSANHHADLFWALRGHSPGAFGIVLEYQFNAINVLCHTAVHTTRSCWPYTCDTARAVISTMLRLVSHPLYRQTKDFKVIAIVTPDFLNNSFMVSRDDHQEERHLLNIFTLWNGEGNRSIHSKMPEDYLSSKIHSNTTFYEFYIDPFKKIPGKIENVSIELSSEEDPKYTLSFIASNMMIGPDIAGNIKQVTSDWKEFLHLPAQEKAAYIEASEKLAREDGVDTDVEEAHYHVSSRYTRSFDFDQTEFVEVFIERMQLLQADPNLWCFAQLFPGLADHYESDYCGVFSYDNWTLWRSSGGSQVAMAGIDWSKGTDTALGNVFGGPELFHLAFSTGNVDIRNDQVRRRYYPETKTFSKLRLIKRKYDPTQVFQTRFTIPPSDDGAFNHQVVDGTCWDDKKPTSWFRMYAGRNFRTVVGQLQNHALTTPSDPFLTWIDEDSKTESVSFGDFHKQVLESAIWLREEKSIQKGDHIVLCYLPGIDSVTALMACMMLGAIPVPAYPTDFGISSRSDKFWTIVNSIRPKLILADRRVLVYQAMAFLGSFTNKFPWANLQKVKHGRNVLETPLASDDVALVQFTSGTTTGTPKGVVLTHGNLLAQFRLYQTEMNYNNKDIVALMWVPMYHDLGLISGLLPTLMNGKHIYFMSPTTFIRKPSTWFAALSQYKITHTAAPNFAYSLMQEKIKDKEIAAWDLSNLEVLASGGEPIEHKMMCQLLRRLEKDSGLRKDTFAPCYGLAENGCNVTVKGKRVLHLDCDALCFGRVSYVPPTQKSVTVVGCGEISNQAPIIIMDDQGGETGEKNIGEIWLSGESLASSYIEVASTPNLEKLGIHTPNRPGRWLATGDLGFVYQRELFVLGRKDDLIFSRCGRRVLAHHVESVANGIGPYFRKGSTTAFQSHGVLCVAVELREKEDDLVQVTANIKLAVSQKFGMLVDRVYIMPCKAAIRTTSGKLERRQTRLAIERGKIPTNCFGPNGSNN